jgi:hypothetical protein
MSGIRRVSDLGSKGVSNILDGSIQAADLSPTIPLSGFRNLIINGGMTIAQRGTAAISNLNSQNTFGTDRWAIFGSNINKMTITQSSVTPTGQGFSNSTLITSSAATSPFSNHYYGLRHFIEGYNTADLAWGTSGAKPIVISFWVRSSIAGTYSLSVKNPNSSRVFTATYTITTADTWEKKIIYIPPETTGTWATDNTESLSLWFDLGSGTDANGAADIWKTSFTPKTSGSVNWVGTSGATFYLTGVQLEQNYQPTPFEQRPISVELQLCQRYFRRTTVTQQYTEGTIYGYGAGGTSVGMTVPFPTTMRSSPTTSINGAFTNNNCGGLNIIAYPDSVFYYVQVTSTGAFNIRSANNGSININAEL